MQQDGDVIRQKIDPEHLLPDITLEPVEPPRPFCTHEIKIDNEATPVGSLCFIEGDDELEGEAWFGWVEVDDDYAGAGIGTATYLAAIGLAHSRGEKFRTDTLCIDPGAVKIWQRFINAGIAQVITPLEPAAFDEEGNSIIFKGHIEVLPSAGLENVK
jgi:GNAT superfamily N-acetyltransferase